MGDLESRVAVLETIIPFVRKELQDHKETVAEFHKESVHGREIVNQKLDDLKSAIAAKENQAKGMAMLLDSVRSFAVFLASFGAFKWLGLIR
jgi:hypothetical protein